MRILYVSQYFPPEMGAPSARVSELARHWAAAGHDVTVLTGFPNHPTGRVASGYRAKIWRLFWRERVDGVNVVRTWLLPLPNRKSHERILNYCSFLVSAAVTGLFLRRPGVVIATSPQLLVGLAGWWLGCVRRVPFVLEIRDLWPESISAVGVAGERSLMHRTLWALADFLYRRAKHVVVVTPAFRDKLVGSERLAIERVSVIENGVETDLFSEQDKTVWKRKLGLEGKFVVSYIGTLGMAHGLEVVLRAAKTVQPVLPQVLFLFVGEGAEKATVIRLAKELQLENVRFVDGQPRERVPGFLAASDACLVTLRRAEVFKTVIPTKMLEFMSCGRPVICNVEGQARAIIQESAGGLCVAPEDPDALHEAILRLYDSPGLCRQLGSSGRNYIVSRLSRKGTAERYARLLERFHTNGRQAQGVTHAARARDDEQVDVERR